MSMGPGRFELPSEPISMRANMTHILGKESQDGKPNPCASRRPDPTKLDYRPFTIIAMGKVIVPEENK